MGPKSKREYLRAIRSRYREARKQEKSKILEEFCAVCGYQRKYAIRLLNRARERPRKKPGPKPRYGLGVLQVVKRIWLTADQICSKRLQAATRLWFPYSEYKYEELSPEIREKVPTTTSSVISLTANAP